MKNRAKLDLHRLNPGRVTILVNSPAAARPFVDDFEAQGFRVEVTTDPSKLYNTLCEGDAPGMVLISDQITSAMGKMLPDFVVKRFKIPVILFREDPVLPAPDLSASVFAPEVLLVGHVTPGELVSTVKNFEQAYEERCLREQNGASGQKPNEAPSTSAPRAAEAVVEVKGQPSSTAEELLSTIKGGCETREVVVDPTDVVVLHACRLPGKDGEGFFVFAFPVRDSGADAAESVRAIEQKLSDEGLHGAKIERLAQGVPGSFFGDLRSHSDEVVSGIVASHEMVMLHFRNRAEVQEPETKVAGENFLVPMEEWWTWLPLPCHAYVWFEINQKRVLYVRPGACLRKEAFERLTKKGVTYLAVDPSDFADYRKIREIIRIAYGTPEAPAA